MFEVKVTLNNVVTNSYKSNSTFTFASTDFGFAKYSLIYTMSFLPIQLLNDLLYPFHLTYNLSPFFFITFSIWNYFWFVLMQLFFVKSSNNSFVVKIINNIIPRHNIFNFFNHENFFGTIWSVTLSKNVFTFWYSKNITNFNFRIFFIILFSRVNICAWFYISSFHFNCTIICTVVFISYII